jgi:voltage-gated potassium channel Kch
MRTLRWAPIVWGALLASSALVLGYVGYRSLPGVNLSRSDALFGSLQLFALDAGRYSEGMPWQLNVARFLAPIAVVYTTVVAIMALLSEQLQRAYVRAFARDHVVLVGMSQSSVVLAAALRRSGSRTVFVESDPTNRRIAGTRANGSRLFIGDATQSVILRRAQAGRARHVVITTGDEARNLEIAERVRELALEGAGAKSGTTVHVAIADQTLWAELGRIQLARAPSGVVVEFYNIIDRAAQVILSEAERNEGLHAYRSVYLDGSGALAQRLLTHLVRRAALAGVHPRVQVSERALRRVLEPILKQEPWMANSADFATADVGGGGSQECPVAFVCVEGSDADAMASGVKLARSRSRRNVYVFVEGNHTEQLLQTVGGVSSLRLISAKERAMGEDFLRMSGQELMARVRHEDYLAQERSRGITPDENPSVVAWEDLPESLKESNRRFAESVGEVISELGGALVPLERLDDGGAFPGRPETLERLARNEHDRWMAALQKDGWTYAPRAKDPVKKTHPLLVGWHELPEDEQEKDRDAIRAIPRMLARVGYAIEIPHDAMQDAALSES